MKCINWERKGNFNKVSVVLTIYVGVDISDTYTVKLCDLLTWQYISMASTKWSTILILELWLLSIPKRFSKK